MFTTSDPEYRISLVFFLSKTSDLREHQIFEGFRCIIELHTERLTLQLRRKKSHIAPINFSTLSRQMSFERKIIFCIKCCKKFMLVKYLENIMVHKMLYQRCMQRNFPYEYLNIYIHVVWWCMLWLFCFRRVWVRIWFSSITCTGTVENLSSSLIKLSQNANTICQSTRITMPLRSFSGLSTVLLTSFSPEVYSAQMNLKYFAATFNNSI